MGQKVKVAAIQLSAEEGQREKNVKKAEMLLCRAALDGAKICVFPELAMDEFFPLKKDIRYFSYGEKKDGPLITRFCGRCKELGIYLVLPFMEKSEIDTYYNAAAVITPDGEVSGIYHKVHVPCTRSYERYYFTPGEGFLVFDTEYGKIGVAICYDRRYPETCRELMKLGARLILIPIGSSIMPGGFSEKPIWEAELRTRAFENQLFLAACNRTGKEGEYTFFGRSMIISPSGEILARADEEEDAVISADIDLDEVGLARTRGPLLRDRRPELYKR